MNALTKVTLLEMKEKKGEWLSVQKAAEKLNVSKSAIYHRIKTGSIKAVDCEGFVFVDLKSLK